MNSDVQNKSIRLEDQECAVCLQKYHFPTQLSCGHVFCFLCVKGIALQGRKCAMCRKHIPVDYLDHPVLLGELPSDQTTTSCNNEESQWYYEGRNGWWKYDDRSNVELEAAFNAGESECMLLLAGTLYCVDFQSMLQFRRCDPTRRRRVKRDIPSLPSKGIAGIKKIEHIQVQQEVNENNENVTNNSLEQESDATEQSDEIINLGSEDENTTTPSSIDVDSITQSLSDITIGNPNELHTLPNEEEP